jgi:AraC-like DNA-binding protein
MHKTIFRLPISAFCSLLMIFLLAYVAYNNHPGVFKMDNLLPLYKQLTSQFGLTGKQQMLLTDIAGVHYFHSTTYSPRTAVAYQPGIVLLGSGRKKAYLADQTFHYNAQQCLLITMPQALECETLASDDEPLQGLFIELNIPKLRQMIDKITQYSPNRFISSNNQLASIIQIDVSTELKQIELRLLHTLQSPLEARMLGENIINELIYRLLCLPQGQHLYNLVNSDNHSGNVARVINQACSNLDQNYTVNELAAQSGMSISAFHRAFKQITKESPLQYFKKMKLFKAKSLIIHEKLNVGLAAQKVGYESISQFSREFKRLFKVPPSQANLISYGELM